MESCEFTILAANKKENVQFMDNPLNTLFFYLCRQFTAHYIFTTRSPYTHTYARAHTHTLAYTRTRRKGWKEEEIAGLMEQEARHRVMSLIFIHFISLLILRCIILPFSLLFSIEIFRWFKALCRQGISISYSRIRVWVREKYTKNEKKKWRFA